jgi:dihydrofolate reductase
MTSRTGPGLTLMTTVTCDLTVSVDGFVAGPRQSLDEPLGEGGERLHRWIFDPQGEDQAVIDAWQQAPGAYVMGRNMFAGPGPGPWDLAWRGWWGEDPPYHHPVVVLSHHPRADLVMDGGTTFMFETGGIVAALERASALAGAGTVAIAGGASTANQYLAAGLVDELHLHIAPLVLGGGARLFEGVGPRDLVPTQVIGSRDVTHVRYRLT